ncbi:ATP-binding protein [Candidatus Tisiphia endosymbiont of Ptychoptera albimana]|uniref:ATP-binding protein n=1 Tax=Candidatus Tisiphia endosymbiont of Ptychoptera albimana TaxID=3066260 RepID=UPI003977391C
MGLFLIAIFFILLYLILLLFTTYDKTSFVESCKCYWIDELSYIPIKAEARFLLFKLFAKLYEQSSFIVTTHLRFEEWGDIFGNPKATKAIIDRIRHHCQIIEIGNKSFRGGKDVD